MFRSYFSFHSRILDSFDFSVPSWQWMDLVMALAWEGSCSDLLVSAAFWGQWLCINYHCPCLAGDFNCRYIAGSIIMKYLPTVESCIHLLTQVCSHNTWEVIHLLDLKRNNVLSQGGAFVWRWIFCTSRGLLRNIVTIQINSRDLPTKCKCFAGEKHYFLS